MNSCRFYRTVYEIDNSINCNGICSGCKIIDKYKQLLNENKIDIISDITNFRDQKHPNKKKRRV